MQTMRVYHRVYSDIVGKNVRYMTKKRGIPGKKHMISDKKYGFKRKRVVGSLV